MKRALAAAVLAFASSAPTLADGPTFPRHVLEPAPVHALFSDRDELVKALVAASKAKRRHDDIGDLYDPEPLVALMASSVEIFLASGEDAAGAEFKLLGRYPPAEALATLGRLSRGEHETPVVLQRYGMHVVEDALVDPTIGPSDWLNGRECTAAYGKIDAVGFVDLVRDTGFEAATWSIVLPTDGDAPWSVSVDPYTLVSLQDLGSRNGAYWAINLPDGTSEEYWHHHLGHEPWATPYLASHACVGMTENGLKLTAIAVRLD
ncbi:MAG: hypothetical protein AB7I79_13650 [Rhizobiaceae bacterium]